MVNTTHRKKLVIDNIYGQRRANVVAANVPNVPKPVKISGFQAPKVSVQKIPTAPTVQVKQQSAGVIPKPVSTPTQTKPAPPKVLIAQGEKTVQKRTVAPAMAVPVKGVAPTTPAMAAPIFTSIKTPAPPALKPAPAAPKVAVPVVKPVPVPAPVKAIPKPEVKVIAKPKYTKDGLEAMNKPKLKDICKELGIKFDAKDIKDDLIQKILSSKK